MQRILSAIILSSAGALSQTTWASFEDRKGHAIASDPVAGTLMFGGESSSTTGRYYGDTSRFIATPSMASWVRLQPVAAPTPRTNHAMAAGTSTDDTAIFILFGGLAEPNGGGSAIPSDETFVYNGGWGSTGIGQTRPAARYRHAMVHDARRNRIILFGGFNGSFALDDTWEFDPINNAWIGPITTSTQPLARFDHAVAYHPGNGIGDGRVYVFGGSPGLDDTWEFNPNSQVWIDASPPPASRPPARSRAAMEYDPASGSLVMFGGANGSANALDDTWTFDRQNTTWTQHSLPLTPQARFDHAMTLEATGVRIILQGGTNGNGDVLPGTWSWAGAQWSHLLPPPPARHSAAMSHSSSQAKNLLFGGEAVSSGVELDDMWELDDVTWREITTTTRPSPRSGAAMAHDAGRSTTVLFGGRDSNGPRGDTWEWNGTSWSQRVVTPSPPPTGGSQLVHDPANQCSWLLVEGEMWQWNGTAWSRRAYPSYRADACGAFDTARGRFVMFGGAPALNDLWEWDENGWEFISSFNVPAWPLGRSLASMVYHPGRQAVVVHGGFDGTGSVTDNTWLWNRNLGTWVAGPNTATNRHGAAATYDPSRAVALIFGGYDSAAQQQTLELAAVNQWSVRQPLNKPPARSSAALAYCPSTSKVVLFGGLASSYRQDTWTYDGLDWQQQQPAVSPRPRHRHGLGTISATGEVLLFGGADGTQAYSDTWSWNGTDWTLHSPAHAPSERIHPMLFAMNGRTLLHGGSMGPAGVPDFWEWTGSNWISVDAPPPAVEDYGAAYDERRQRVVVFGGRDLDAPGTTYSSETWEWNGKTWSRRFPQSSPSPRAGCRLAFDADRGRIVLFGGQDGTTTWNDTWEWDGQDWRRRAPLNQPVGSAYHAMVFDAATRRTVLLSVSGTWDYGPEVPGDTHPFGSGCPGTNGTPAITPKPWAGPWLGERFEADFTNAPPGAAIVIWGFSNQLWLGNPLPFSLAPFGGGPGCELLVSDDINQLLIPGPSGVVDSYTSFLLPNHPAFVGAEMFLQAGFLDAGQNGSPVTTRGLEVIFGSK